MQIIPVSSRIIKAGDNLLDALTEAITKSKQKIDEKDVIVISSKVIALSQNRVKKLIHRDNRSIFREVVESEADYFVPGDIVDFTFKYNIIIPNAGIDKSNAEPGTVILWPENPQATVDELRLKLMSHYKLRNLGVMMIDSHCIPLRKGTSGICLAYSGFIGVEDCRGQKDLYQNPLKITQEAKADELASASNIMMGEGDQARPFVIIKGAPVTFTARQQDSIKAQAIPYDQCIFNTVMNFPKPDAYDPELNEF